MSFNLEAVRKLEEQLRGDALAAEVLRKPPRIASVDLPILADILRDLRVQAEQAHSERVDRTFEAAESIVKLQSERDAALARVKQLEIAVKWAIDELESRQMPQTAYRLECKAKP